MPSELRLHPVSILFALGGSLKALAVPALLVLLGTSRSSSGGPGRFLGVPQGRWEIWAMLLLIPAAAMAIARYLSFRLRYEETELVIRTGIVFRNERHIPYTRIQNLGAVRNVLHRLLGVTEVRVETGGGREVEATISVIPAAAFEEMRRRVFDARAPRHAAVAAGASGAIHQPAADDQALLQLPLRELMLLGLIENRSILVIGALTGLLWELGLIEGVADRLFGDRSYGRGLARDVVRALAAGGELPIERMLLALVVAAALLTGVQLASIAWTVARLHGFRLTRVGEDLRTEFGLLTRVTNTIPLRRIQTVTVYEGPLQRLAARTSVRVETAGGVGAATSAGAASKEREWIAPILRAAALPALAHAILPEFDPAGIAWQPVHPRAFRRAVKKAIAAALAVSALAAMLAGPAGAVLLVAALPWAVVVARMQVRRLGWAADGDVVAFRRGWIWRRVTVVRVVKIQAVSLLESPFDRRTTMARLRVDTAGATERSHRVDVPYLPRDVALGLHRHLAARAASTVFRW